ncbi:MAG TPA: DedA family protein [Bdellovibrionota bacterium]|nr:DedA family protein [Bdellovibrionota bacterium]
MHLDTHLTEWAARLGPGLYLLLFGIVFAETGLVVTPFLPGDSLLFAVGALAALPDSPVHFPEIGFLLMLAALTGDLCNFTAGRIIGPKVFSRRDSLFLNHNHLDRTQAFYERHGGKTIIMARFIPIVRTFAPFVAGIGKMRFRRFAAFSVGGATAWVWGFTSLGYLFGNLPAVRRNFQFVVLGIIAVSVTPMVFELISSRRARGSAARARNP